MRAHRLTLAVLAVATAGACGELRPSSLALCDAGACVPADAAADSTSGNDASKDAGKRAVNLSAILTGRAGELRSESYRNALL
jgi:hypothetical protein